MKFGSYEQINYAYTEKLCTTVNYYKTWRWIKTFQVMIDKFKTDKIYVGV
jgi:hypothetical protein